jgi:hypothetical protein
VFFAADVIGTNNPDTSVTWSVQGNGSSGTYIDSTGYLYVDLNETATTLTVKATSNFDTNQSGTALVYVSDSTPPGGVSSFTGIAGDGQVTLNWYDPADADLDHIIITWNGGNSFTVPKSSAGNRTNSTTITGLNNKTEYAFSLYAVDTWGNQSAGTEYIYLIPQAPTGTGTVSVQFTGPRNEDITLTGVDGNLSWAANTALTVSVNGSYTAYRWVLDNVILDETGSTLTLYAGNLGIKRFGLTVYVTKDGVEYAKRVTFTVAQ